MRLHRRMPRGTDQCCGPPHHDTDYCIVRYRSSRRDARHLELETARSGADHPAGPSLNREAGTREAWRRLRTAMRHTLMTFPSLLGIYHACSISRCCAALLDARHHQDQSAQCRSLSAFSKPLSCDGGLGVAKCCSRRPLLP